MKTLIAKWDTLDITEREMDWRRSEGHFPELSDDELFERVCRDPDLFTRERQDLCDYLTKWITRYNPDGAWMCEGTNMGWRHQSGTKSFTAITGEELLEAVLPKADCTFKIWTKGGELDELTMKIWHHDAPVGENRYLVPAHYCCVCDKVFTEDGVEYGGTRYCSEDCAWNDGWGTEEVA